MNQNKTTPASDKIKWQTTSEIQQQLVNCHKYTRENHLRQLYSLKSSIFLLPSSFLLSPVYNSHLFLSHSFHYFTHFRSDTWLLVTYFSLLDYLFEHMLVTLLLRLFTRILSSVSLLYHFKRYPSTSVVYFVPWKTQNTTKFICLKFLGATPREKRMSCWWTAGRVQ